MRILALAVASALSVPAALGFSVSRLSHSGLTRCLQTPSCLSPLSSRPEGLPMPQPLGSPSLRRPNLRFQQTRIAMKKLGDNNGQRSITDCSRFGLYLLSEAEKSTPIEGVRAEEFDSWLEQQDDVTKAWVQNTNFEVKPGDYGRHLIIPSSEGKVLKVLVVVGDAGGFGEYLSFASLPKVLPKAAGPYHISSAGGVEPDLVALAWAMGTYTYTVYKNRGEDMGEVYAKLVWPEGAKREVVETTAEGIFITRDLINSPPDDMAPGDLEAAAQALKAKHQASLNMIIGDDLLRQNYPQVHAVGRANMEGKHAPRLIDIRWGNKNDPRVTLIGKGVTFDTGGLDIKPPAGMRQMKKDMGGAALILGLAHMIMSSKLKVNLRVLVPTVENAISGNAFRPGDILVARNGLTTEIGNTDAEGRLILADALVAACEEDPELLLDAATLTGAGRVALGTDVPAVFVNNEEIAAQLYSLSLDNHDLVWRLPLFKGYAKSLSSSIADTKNIAEGSGYGGAITAALYLAKYITEGTDWIHMDFMAFNTVSRPGRPEGGEAMGLRALYALLKARFS